MVNNSGEEKFAKMISLNRSFPMILAAGLMLSVIISGCGGGGGKDGGTSTPHYIVTGEVKDFETDAPIVGAVVKFGSTTVTTGSTGKYSFDFSTAPSANNWSVDASSAKPNPDLVTPDIEGNVPGYYTYWAKLGMLTEVFDPKTLPIPSLSNGTTTMETVYLLRTNKRTSAVVYTYNRSPLHYTGRGV